MTQVLGEIMGGVVFPYFLFCFVVIEKGEVIVLNIHIAKYLTNGLSWERVALLPYEPF